MHDDAAERPPLTFGRFLQMVARKDARALEAHGCPYVSVEKAAMAEFSGATGGYLVTPELKFDAFSDVGEEALVSRWSKPIPMTSAELDLPLPDAQTAVTAGFPPYFGGMKLLWDVEAHARTESDPAMRQLALRAHELTCEVVCSNNLLQDAPALEGHLRTLFGRAVAWASDQAFLVGDGVGKPRGVLSVSTAVTRSGSNAFAAADAQGMVEKLLPSSWPKAIWVAHPSVMVKMTALTNWQPNENPEPGQGRSAGSLHAIPLYVSDKLNALGTAGDVLLFDPTLYAIGNRGVLIDASSDVPTLHRQNQTVFRIVARVGGLPYLSGSVTLADGTKTAGAYVSLTT